LFVGRHCCICLIIAIIIIWFRASRPPDGPPDKKGQRKPDGWIGRGGHDSIYERMYHGYSSPATNAAVCTCMLPLKLLKGQVASYATNIKH